MKDQLNILRLTYPPITNKHAAWEKDDPDVKKAMAESKLYMICQKPRALFDHSCIESFKKSGDLSQIPFEIICGGNKTKGSFDLQQIIEASQFDDTKEDLSLETGEDFYRFVSESSEGRKVIRWFTPEIIFQEKWRGSPEIIGIDDLSRFTEYQLHYIGISKSQSSYKRLVKDAHKARGDILSLESPMEPHSIPTDEIILLFFTIESSRATLIKNEKDIDDMLSFEDMDMTPVIADAEKAFIKILDSEYNLEKYKNYPKGNDGLFDTGLTSYRYVIGEGITLKTSKERIQGQFDLNDIPLYCDKIEIRGEEVLFAKSTKTPRVNLI